jgi:hypothetical protein
MPSMDTPEQPKPSMDMSEPPMTQEDTLNPPRWGIFLPYGPCGLTDAQEQVDRQLSNSDVNKTTSTKYMHFNSDKLPFCRDNKLYSIAIPRPVIPISNSRHLSLECEEFELTQLTSDTESYMCMLKRRNRTWTVKLSKHGPEYMKRELRNHICVFQNMDRFWLLATCHLETPVFERAKGKSKGSAEQNQRKVKRWKWLRSPGVPRPESEAIVYRVCKQGIAPAGFMMDYIPPVLRDQVRALANSYIDPSIRKSVKDDPNVADVRFQIRFGEDTPPDEALNTKLLSRPVYREQLFHGKTVDVGILIEQMGASLAIIHWLCKLDGTGVEFHLAPELRRKSPTLWMTHFGDCQTLEGEDETTAMAEVFCSNPTWPQPGSHLMEDVKESRDWGHDAWLRFANAYFSTSNKCLGKPTETREGLPFTFLKKVERMSRQSKAGEQESSTGQVATTGC